MAEISPWRPAPPHPTNTDVQLQHCNINQWLQMFSSETMQLSDYNHAKQT